MAQANSIRIEALSKHNYETWKIQIEAVLVKNDTWIYVSGEYPKPEVNLNAEAADLAAAKASEAAWMTQDRKAKSDLILAISPSELSQVRGCTTSKEIWTKLEAAYASKGPARKATLLKRLTQSKMIDGQDVREYLSNFFDIVDKLKNMEITINDDLLTIMLLSSLPDSFENFRCAIESRDSLPNIETLRVKIVEEYDARIRKTNDGPSGALLAKHNTVEKRNKYNYKNNASSKLNQNKSEKTFNEGTTYKCNYCGKRGHKAADCFKKKRKEQEKANASTATYFACSETKDTSNQKWCLDSGCTAHLCKNDELIENLRQTKSGLNLATNLTSNVTAKGDVKISTWNGKENVSVKLCNTLYVPDLRTNLISVAKIVDKGDQVVFTKDRALVTNNKGEVKIIADRDGDLFYLQEQSQQDCKLSNTRFGNADEWHQKLGHLNAHDLLLMSKKKLIPDLSANLGTCKTCVTCKLTRAPFKNRSDRASGLLEIIHSDVCGPMRTESQGGARYFVTFIDDYSRWCMIYFIRNKSEVISKFQEYKNFVETQTGRKVKALQSDNGTEYCNNKMDEILKSSGIQRRLTTVYTPQQNGNAERKNRTLVEAARCMLTESGLPPSFWAEAIATANHIRNRCVTKSLDGEIPYMLWTGKSPHLSYLQLFGCKAYVLNKAAGKRKFDKKILEGIFVGYPTTSKGHRIWVPSENKIHVSRDVKFLNEFQHQQNYEDIVSENTRNGRDNFEDLNSSKEMIIDSNQQHIMEEYIKSENCESKDVTTEENISTDVTNIQINQDSIEINDTPSDSSGYKRARGRPSKLKTGSKGRPMKVYKQVRIDTQKVENLDEQEMDWHEAEFAAIASEIPLSTAISGSDKLEWEDAIYTEIQSLIANDTWNVIDRPEDARVIGCRMILRNKWTADGTLERRKARLVARGFLQKPGVDFHDTFAPVARLNSLRLLVALASKQNMHISQLDITSAYLNGKVEENIYMDTPILLEKMLHRMAYHDSDKILRKKAFDMLKSLQGGDKVCKLNKSLYGLRQSGRQWNIEIDRVLKKSGLKATNSDTCIYVDKNKTTFVLLYVDDLLIFSSNCSRENQIKKTLSECFTVRDLGEANYCLGIQISRKKDEICLSQSGYIEDILSRFNMQTCKPVYTPLASTCKLTKGEADKTCDVPYRELIGALMYLATATRPDIAYSVSALSQFNDCYSQEHWVAAKRVLRYLRRTTHYALKFSKSDDTLKCFVDADWGNCSIDRRSYTGSVFLLENAAISWESRKQRTVALSSAEAEYMAVSDAGREAIFLSNFLAELGFENLGKVTMFNDNQSAAKLAKNPIHHSRTKHIDIKFHFIRDVLKNQPVMLEYLPTEDMVADIFTKPLPRVKHERCLAGLGLHQIQIAN